MTNDGSIIGVGTAGCVVAGHLSEHGKISTCVLEAGPFTITDIDETDPLCDASISGAESLGVPRNPDYNGRSQEGIAYAQRSVFRGRRVSSARSFVNPAMQRGTLGREFPSRRLHRAQQSGDRG